MTTKKTLLYSTLILGMPMGVNAGAFQGPVTDGITDESIEIVNDGADGAGIYIDGYQKFDTYRATEGDIVIRANGRGINNESSPWGGAHIDLYAERGIINVSTNGDAEAVYAAGANNTIEFHTEVQASTSSGSTKAVIMADNDANIILNGGSITSGAGVKGVAIYATDSDVDSKYTDITLKKAQYHIQGIVMSTGEQAGITMELAGNSTFYGATKDGSCANPHGTQMTLYDNSTWIVSDHSALASLTTVSNPMTDDHVNLFFSYDVESSAFFSIDFCQQVDLGSSTMIYIDSHYVSLYDEITLFSYVGEDLMDEYYRNGGIKLVSINGLYTYEYTDDNGTFTITGINSLPTVPEPTAASLGLLGLALLMQQRRRFHL